MEPNKNTVKLAKKEIDLLDSHWDSEVFSVEKGFSYKLFSYTQVLLYNFQKFFSDQCKMSPMLNFCRFISYPFCYLLHLQKKGKIFCFIANHSCKNCKSASILMRNESIKFSSRCKYHNLRFISWMSFNISIYTGTINIITTLRTVKL